MWVQAAGMGEEQPCGPGLPGPLPAHPGQVRPGHLEGPGTHAQPLCAAQGPHPRPRSGMFHAPLSVRRHQALLVALSPKSTHQCRPSKAHALALYAA